MRVSIRMGVVALVFVGVGPGLATASQDPPIDVADTRWMPWLGCWHLSEEQLEVGALPRDDAPPIEHTSVCVAPTGDGAILTAAVRDDVLVSRRLIADGVQHPIEDESCTGWERSEWSRDGQRLFTSGEIECADEPQRQLTGVSFMTSTASWVDIQLVTLGERQQLEIRRYSPTPRSAASRLPGAPTNLSVDAAEAAKARQAITEALVLSDVHDASEKTSPRVVESLLIETEPNLNLDSDAVIALDDAGINYNVIDLLVALSYPDQFVVQKRNRGGGWSARGAGGFGRYYDPIWYGDLYPYYVTPFGSRVWRTGYYPYFTGGYASPFLVLPSVVPERGSGTARAYNPSGYTRVSPRGARQVQSRSRGSSGGTSGRRVGTGGSSGRGVATAGGGYSGDGGTTSTGSGRTAVPR